MAFEVSKLDSNVLDLLADMSFVDLLLDAFPGIIFITDEKGAVLAHSAGRVARQRMAGTESCILLGQEIISCVETHPHTGENDTCGICAAVSEAKKSGQSVRKLCKKKIKAGLKQTEYSLSVTASRIEHHGKIYFYFAIEDLTDLVKLQNLLPICSHCKKVRDSENYWQQVDSYLRENYDMLVSHAICDDCLEELYPDDDDESCATLSDS